MIVSTKGRYAMRVMIDLAEHRDEGLVPLHQISERQRISEKYLENILRSLVQGGLLKGTRGKSGGYCLTRDPKDISALEVLMLTESSLAPVRCLDRNADACPMTVNCRTLPLWKELDEAVTNLLGSYTVADLVESAREA